MQVQVEYGEFIVFHEKWQRDCLAEYNEFTGENRMLLADAGDDYDPGTVVEFSEDGAAYPHGACGTNYIPRAVTPWADSVHYVE